MEPLQLAKKAAEILDNKKGEQIKILEISDLTVIADYFVIATGSSTTHVRALAGEVEYILKQDGTMPLRTEGEDTAGWIVLDYGSVLIHVFSEQSRDFYSLEKVWADAKPVE